MKMERNQYMRGEALKRQLYMLSNLGLFYIILLALFAVPLMGTFVVVLIKGVLDFRYAIIGSGIIILASAIFFTARFGWRLYRRIRMDGAAAFRDAAGRTERGEPVQLVLFNGLMTLSYGGRRSSPVLLTAPDHPTPLLPDMSGDAQTSDSSRNPIDQIHSLARLKRDGMIDDNEFIALKKKVFQDLCDEPNHAVRSIDRPRERGDRSPSRN